MSPQNERTGIFLSELKHVDMFERLLSKRPDLQKEGYLLIPLDAEIEYALTAKEIPFCSGRGYRTHDTEPMTRSEQWIEALFNSDRWAFFKYRGVSLSRLYFFPLQAYLTSLLYYADIVAQVFARHSALSRCIVFPPTIGVPPRGFCLEVHNIKTVVDVVRFLGTQRNIKILIPEITIPIRARTFDASFEVRQMLFGWGIGLLNFFVSSMRRPRRVRILASDYWFNLEPYLNALGSAEVFLLDRKEAFKAGFFNIWRFRMRFVHLDAYAKSSPPERDHAREQITEAWRSIQKDSAIPEFLFRGFSLRPLVVQALGTVVADAAAHVLKDIDDTYTLIARVKPDVVELRSTMSGQTHFVILAQVARALKIPSLEMQHGIEYYGKGSMDRRHSAEHIGVYGPLTQRELRVAEDDITTHVVGSPRFDVYASLPEIDRAKQPILHAGLTVLCIAPPVKPGTIDTYDVEEYFSAIAAAARGVPNMSIIVKLRAGPPRQSFYEAAIARAFAGVPHATAQYEPLAELFPPADIVVSNYSTATLEALQCGKPLIYFGASPGFDLMAEFHLAVYEQKGALMIAKTPDDLARGMQALTDPQARERMSGAATAFLKNEYAFDGRASKRAASLMSSLASLKSR